MSEWVKDSIGSVQIPDGAPFGIHTWRARNLGSLSARPLGRFSEYVVALLQVKIAAARANHVTGGMTTSEWKLIETAAASVERSSFETLFPVDLLLGGGSIAIHRNINEVLERTPARPNLVTLNLSQSTADVCHTALRVALYRMARQVLGKLSGFCSSVQVLAAQSEGVRTVSRTCLRDALPASYGDFFSGFASGLSRRIEMLDRSIDTLRQINIGGTVIGSGDGASPQYREAVLANLKQITELPLELRANLFDAAQHSDDLGSFSFELAAIARLLMKLAKDLRLLGSGPETGLNEIKLPAVMEGSSFFPGKVNPIIPESVIQCGLQIIGNDQVVQMAWEQAELNLNVYESVMAANLNDNLSILMQLVPLFEECVRSLQFNHDICNEYAEKVDAKRTKTSMGK